MKINRKKSLKTNFKQKTIFKIDQYCIKTGAKKKYDHLINNYFKIDITDQEKMVIEAQIETLKFFLENADFNRLRGLYPELNGFNEVQITLATPDNCRDMTILYNGKTIKPEWKDEL